MLVRIGILALAFLTLTGSPVHAQDSVAEARRLYNAGQYDQAERAARAALSHPNTAAGARVVLARVRLEQFRRSAAPADLNDARTVLREIDPRALDQRERLELTLGFGEALFLEDRFAAAADVFEPVLGSVALLGPAARERVLDWWATALDRHAQGKRPADRPAVYSRISQRMRDELERDQTTSTASYWLVAATRGTGDIDGAWSAAMAAWVRATFARDQGAELRGDLDRLVVQGIIPERASRISPREPANTIAGLTREWEAFKADWSR